MVRNGEVLAAVDRTAVGVDRAAAVDRGVGRLAEGGADMVRGEEVADGGDSSQEDKGTRGKETRRATVGTIAETIAVVKDRIVVDSQVATKEDRAGTEGGARDGKRMADADTGVARASREAAGDRGFRSEGAVNEVRKDIAVKVAAQKVKDIADAKELQRTKVPRAREEATVRGGDKAEGRDGRGLVQRPGGTAILPDKVMAADGLATREGRVATPSPPVRVRSASGGEDTNRAPTSKRGYPRPVFGPNRETSPRFPTCCHATPSSPHPPRGRWHSMLWVNV